MLRLFPALLGLGLAALWLVGLDEDATLWMTWCNGIAAALCFATVGIIPDRRGSPWAAFCLGAIAAGLLAMWVVALRTHATPWLAWWTFAAALATALVGFAAGVQGALEALRTREVI
ncbi:MAG TPA: hypothetical protein VN962_08565 [Polyangia bacterium]|nr:hypothetical protein [Polyangia bacterium]